MRILSITVGMPREIPDGDAIVLSGIYKDAVVGPVRVSRAGLEGDGQADPDHHGGRLKAVYAYPAEHYPRWQRELGRELPWGTFGENLTIEGLDEEALHCGDTLRAGTAVLAVTQPRKPCRKLGLRMGDVGFVEKFWRAGRTGIYFEVQQPGTVRVGDGVEVLDGHPDAPTIRQIWEMAALASADPEQVRRALALPHLSEEWRRPLRAALAGLTDPSG